MQESRRDFLIKCIATASSIAGASITIGNQPSIANVSEKDTIEFKGKAVFERIIAKADADGWRRLPIGDLIGKIARQLEGTPYVASTLELYPDREVCSVNLAGLDCVTFIETTLAFARMLKQGGSRPEQLLNEVATIRYRGGSIGDYSTRLHYMSDWLAENNSRQIVKLLADLPGSETFNQKVAFMSTHAPSYRRLITQPEQVVKIKKIEEAINSRNLKYVPMGKIAAIGPLLQTGDIVAVCTRQAGLDVVHTGFVYRTTDGVTHFIDASSSKHKMKVTLEAGAIHNSLNWSQNLTGAMFARPQEVIKA